MDKARRGFLKLTGTSLLGLGLGGQRGSHQGRGCETHAQTDVTWASECLLVGHDLLRLG